MSLSSDEYPLHSYFEWRFSDFFYTAYGSSVVYANGTVQGFTGHTSSNPIGTAWGTGDRLRFDPNGWRPLELLLADGGRVIFSEVVPGYFASTSVIDPHGFTITVTYQGKVPRRIQDPTGRWIEFQLDGWGRPTQATSSNGDLVSYSWTPSPYWADTVTGLTRVDYADGTSATYDLYPSGYLSAAGGLLKTARDVRAEAAMPQVTYTYHEEYLGYGDANANVFYYRTAFDTERTADEAHAISQLLRQTDYPDAPAVVYERAVEVRPDGARRTFNYDRWSVYYGTPKLTSETDFNGSTWTYQYDSRGMRTAETDPLGRTTTYTREPVARNITAVRYHDGSQTSTTYTDAANPYHIRSVTDELGRTTTYDRFGNGIIGQINYPDGSTEGWNGLNQFNQPTIHRFKNGAHEWWNFDGMGRLTRHWLASFGGQQDSIAYTYYADGHPWEDRVRTVTDPRGNVTTYEYDLKFVNGAQGTEACPGRGLVTKIINPDGSYKSFGYDIYGNKIWEENELRQRTSYTYDEYKRLRTATDPLGRVTDTRYGDNDTETRGQTYNTPQRIFSPSGKLTTYLYDANKRPWLKAEGDWTPDCKYWRYEYDAVGNMTKLREQTGGSWGSEVWRDTTYEYDNRNRRTKQVAPLSRITEWRYDAVGNVTTVINPDGTTNGKGYDSMNRVTSETDEMNYTVGYTYWPSGKVNVITDRRGYTYRHEYDAYDRLTMRWYPAASGSPNGSAEGWGYDAAGNLSYYVNRSAQRLNYTYDSRNRETRRWWDGNVAPEVNTGYDSVNRVTSRNNANTSLSYTYDAAGQLRYETQSHAGGPSVTVEYNYNNDGKRSTFSSSAGTWIGYTYDNRNALKQIQQWSGSAPIMWAAYSYNVTGERRFRTHYNGTESDYNYDGAGRLNYLHSYRTNDGSWIQMEQYGYDVRDRRSWYVRNQASGDTYRYQADGQLTEFRNEVWRPDQNFWNAAAWTDTFNYDSSGNRTSWNENGSVTNYNTDALNQYTSVSGSAVGYSDGRGNLNLWRDWTFQYDADNRLTYAGRSGYQVWFYYDAEGRLTRLNRNGAWEYRYYDGMQCWLRTRSDGSWIDFTIWGPKGDEVVSRWDPAHGGWQFYHQNGIGSPVAITDMSRNVMERYLYDPFGELDIRDPNWAGRSATAIANPFLFTGQEWMGDIGIANYKNRFYQPNLGRFLQNDPIRFDGGDLNLYRYVKNSPVNLVDPDGRLWSWPAVGAGTAIGAVGGTAYGLGSQSVSWLKGGEFSMAAVGRAAAGGAAGGAITGAVVGAATGDPSALLVGGSATLTVGGAAAAGFAGGATEGVLTPVGPSSDSANAGLVITPVPMDSGSAPVITPVTDATNLAGANSAASSTANESQSSSPGGTSGSTSSDLPQVKFQLSDSSK